MVGDRIVFLISIPEQCSCVHGSNLQNMLSIKVPFLFENRVGNVICGHRLCAINRSKKSQYIIFSCIFSRFMLVSPAKIMLAFCLSIHSRTGVNSSITSLRMSLPGFGGLYKLKITVEFCRPPPDTFMAIPSQYLYVFKCNTSSLSNLLSIYTIIRLKYVSQNHKS